MAAFNGNELRQTFNEDFNSLSLWNGSTGIWRTDFGYGATPNDLASRTLPNNGELQIYVDPSFRGTASQPLGITPFWVQNGVLSIVAGAATPAVQSAIGGYGYTSGLITTKMSFAQTYGYFEMRADLPAGQGVWPAFWLLPANGNWPPEIDVLEGYGLDNQTEVAVHTNETWVHTSQVFKANVPGATSGFHVYGMLWDQAKITWYVDYVEVASVATPADMHQPMYMLANLAITSNALASSFPNSLNIDYIRAYALDGFWGGVARDGGPGGDTIQGTAAIDQVRGLDGNDSILGGANIDDLNGNVGNDTLDGGDGEDWVRGGQGNDLVIGGFGDDHHVNGNLGNDLVYGGPGGDAVFGGQGDDMVFGDDGDDILSGNKGNDTLSGGLGSDVFVFRPGDGLESVGDFNLSQGDKVQLLQGQTYTILNVGGHAVIDLGNGDQMHLWGVAPSALDNWVVFA